MIIHAQTIFDALDNPDYKEHLAPSPSPRAKRLSLRVHPKERQIKLVIPKGAKLKNIVGFVEKHENWIKARIDEFPINVPYEAGQYLPIFGKERLIAKHLPKDGQHSRTTIIELGDEHLNIYTNREQYSTHIKKWLKEEALHTLKNLSHEKAAEINKTVAEVSVRDTVSRWGSCSADGRLSYSWRLIFTPFDVIDYVAAHEVAHLQHMDHSKNFWNVCESLSENMAFGKQWLKMNGSDLMRFG